MHSCFILLLRSLQIKNGNFFVQGKKQDQGYRAQVDKERLDAKNDE